MTMGITPHQQDGPTGGPFEVTGFSGCGFREQARVRELVSPPHPYLADLVMIRGEQTRRHRYWLRYLRRQADPTGIKRVCADLLVSFTTFDYVPLTTDPGRGASQGRALQDFPCWGVADLAVSLNAVGNNRNPFNKFNESGELVFTPSFEGGFGALPRIRLGYRVHHEQTVVDGVELTPGHDEVGSLLVHTDGRLTIEQASMPTRRHFTVTMINGGVHDRPSAYYRAVDASAAEPVRHEVERISSAPALPAQATTEAYADGSVLVTGFRALAVPNELAVIWRRRDGTAGEAVRAVAGEPDPGPGGMLLEYRYEPAGQPAGHQRKVRVLLALRFATFGYVVERSPDDDRHPVPSDRRHPDGGPADGTIVHHRGRRHSGFREVSLTVLEAETGTRRLLGPAARRYDVVPVKNSAKVPALLTFTGWLDQDPAQGAPLLRIGWRAELADPVADEKLVERGVLALGTDRLGTPVLTALDEASERRLTLTG